MFCAMDPTGSASLEGILSTMSSYRLVHLPTVGDLRNAGLALLPTATRPHFTLLNTGGGTLDPSHLLVVLREPRPNPFHER